MLQQAVILQHLVNRCLLIDVYNVHYIDCFLFIKFCKNFNFRIAYSSEFVRISMCIQQTSERSLTCRAAELSRQIPVVLARLKRSINLSLLAGSFIQFLSSSCFFQIEHFVIYIDNVRLLSARQKPDWNFQRGPDLTGVSYIFRGTFGYHKDP